MVLNSTPTISGVPFAGGLPAQEPTLGQGAYFHVDYEPEMQVEMRDVWRLTRGLMELYRAFSAKIYKKSDELMIDGMEPINFRGLRIDCLKIVDQSDKIRLRVIKTNQEPNRISVVQGDEMPLREFMSLQGRVSQAESL